MNLAPESRPSISTMNGLGNAIARQVDVDDSADGQRIDNFLLRILKGVPRSHVYRLVRGGEVRVNSGRVDQTYRLRAGDRIRIPPVRVAQRKGAGAAQRITAAGRVRIPVLFEDEALLIVDKPAGCAVHGGSGVSFGVIEQLRAERPEARFLELVHRLDRDTSGVLVIAKRRAALTPLHDIWRAGEIDKVNLAMVAGDMAAQTAIQASRQGDVSASALKSYDEAWRARYGRQRAGLLSLRRLLAGMSEAEYVDIIDTLARQPAGNMNHGQLMLAAFLRHPRLLLEARALVNIGIHLK